MATKTITKEELQQHKDGKSCWIAVHDKVYDITKFLEEVNKSNFLRDSETPSTFCQHVHDHDHVITFSNDLVYDLFKQYDGF